MGESTDGDNDDMSWQDVTRKRKNRSNSSEILTLGLEMGDMNKTTMAAETSVRKRTNKRKGK